MLCWQTVWSSLFLMFQPLTFSLYRHTGCSCIDRRVLPGHFFYFSNWSVALADFLFLHQNFPKVISRSNVQTTGGRSCIGTGKPPDNRRYNTLLKKDLPVPISEGWWWDDTAELGLWGEAWSIQTETKPIERDSINTNIEQILSCLSILQYGLFSVVLLFTCEGDSELVWMSMCCFVSRTASKTRCSPPNNKNVNNLLIFFGPLKSEVAKRRPVHHV